MGEEVSQMRSGPVVFAAAPDVPADSAIGPGLLGFLVVVALGLALVFLYRSLRKQLRLLLRVAFRASSAPEILGVVAHLRHARQQSIDHGILRLKSCNAISRRRKSDRTAWTGNSHMGLARSFKRSANWVSC